VQESLIHGGIANDVGVEIAWTSSDLFTTREGARDRARASTACSCRAASACAAWKGWWSAIRACRETKIPFFGICLGMQVAIIEFARTSGASPTRNSSEFAPECAQPCDLR
jgi:CTP synthase